MDQKLSRTHSLSPQLTPARATSIFKNTMGNLFFWTFLHTDRNASKKNLE